MYSKTEVEKIALTRPWIIVEKLTVLLLVLFCSSAGILSCAKEKGRDFKANSPPVITSADILPATPRKTAELNVFVQSQNPDRNPVIFHYQWLRNSEEIVGSDKPTLKCSDFKKGDLIQVKVTPSDGKIAGKGLLSPPVKILNSPPMIEELRIEPKLVVGDLTVSVKSLDPDGDSVNYTYQWEKNGTILREEKTGILERGQFKKGDSIAVTVVPDDGEASGSPMKSEPIAIANSPPVITSSPPKKTVGNLYTYQVMTNYPDNDAIMFALKTAPKGMEINRETGLLHWEIRKTDRGPHSVEIEASNREGQKCFQRYTLNIELR